MTTGTFHQASKEFQLKVKWPPAGSKGKSTPGATDQQIFQLVTDTIAAAVSRIANDKPCNAIFTNNMWRREGIRYDTTDRDLKQHNLTLAVEATDERTKLKCKAHNFIAELLFDKPKNSICLPDCTIANAYKKADCKLKLEQDLHFSNVKYCASGSLFVKGRQTQVTDLAFFTKYFPRLKKLLPGNTSLTAVSHWDEAVFDDMQTVWGETDLSTWMLVNRWDWEKKILLESELSFKVDKDYKIPWDFKLLKSASDLYLELQKTGVFLPAPPIFFFDNPVSSTDIQVAP